jgi:hypothetical protein
MPEVVPRACGAITAKDRGMDKDSDIDRAGRARRGSPFLNTEQAAAYLKLSPRQLKRLRRAGNGPGFRRHSRYIQYHIDDLDDWSRGQSGRGFER